MTLLYTGRKLFILPTGRARKDYKDEITWLLNARIRDNGDAILYITETQSQLKSEGSF